MSAADIRIAEKRGQADAARDALLETVDEIKDRLAPGALASDAWEGAKEKGVSVASGAVDSVIPAPGACRRGRGGGGIDHRAQTHFQSAGRAVHR